MVVLSSNGATLYGVKSMSVSGNVITYVLTATYTQTFTQPGVATQTGGPYTETMSGSVALPSCVPGALGSSTGAVAGASSSDIQSLTASITAVNTGLASANLPALASSVSGFSNTLAAASNDASIDYSMAGALWAFFFTSVVSLFFLSKTIGLVLEGIRRW